MRALAVDETLTASEVRQLYVAHAAELRQALARLAPDVDADDLLQELFVIALRKPHALARAEVPRAWLYGVAVKLAATRRRAARVRRFLGLEAAQDVGGGDSPARTAEQRDAWRLLERALRPLGSSKRDVFVLFELQGLSGEDIAAALGVPVKTVWTRLFHARKAGAAELSRLQAIEARTSGLACEEVRR